jgi:hypothetical protein
MVTVERHNHFTRDIKPRGSDCPACENYWAGVPHVVESEGSNAVE